VIVAIHQPNFLPWIGYFYKIASVDTFVFLDDVQFSKNSYTNRNLIQTPNGAQWLTMPVIQSNKFGQKISEVEIFNIEQTKIKCLRSIENNYKKAPNFKAYFEQLTTCFNTSNLAELNINIITLICSLVDIKTTLIKSSALQIATQDATKRLVDIAEALNAKKYISGFGGNNYQDQQMFANKNITLQTYSFKHPTYSQLWNKEFTPNLSIIDFIFNENMEAIHTFLHSHTPL
jgi:WbqC-like protein family